MKEDSLLSSHHPRTVIAWVRLTFIFCIIMVAVIHTWVLHYFLVFQVLILANTFFILYTFLYYYLVLNSIKIFKWFIIVTFLISRPQFPLPSLLPAPPNLPSSPDPLLLYFPSEKGRPPGISIKHGITSYTCKDKAHAFIWRLDVATL